MRQVTVKLLILAVWIQTVSISWAETPDHSFTVKKDEPSYKSGSVFMSSNKKDEVLLKANIWGAVQFPGVHYIPMGTRLVDAISYAGGPLDSADVESITLSTKTTPSTIASQELSIPAALRSQDRNPVIHPDDVIVIREDRSHQKATMWLAIGTFVISAAALGVAIAR